MGWLVRLTVASMVGAVLVVKIFETIFGGILGPALVHAKNSTFVSAWATITAALGLHDIKKGAGNLRKGSENPLKKRRFK